MPKVFDEFVVLKPNLQMDQLQVSPDIYEKLGEMYDGFKSHTLVSAHRFSGSWLTWEIHPEGDEMVILLSGSARFTLRHESGDESVALKNPGSFLVVPKNTWHTAIIDEPTSMLFITPGEGTLNETTPPVKT